MLLLLGFSGWFFFLPAMHGLYRLGTSSQFMFWELEHEHCCNFEDKEQTSVAGSQRGKIPNRQLEAAQPWRLPQSFWDHGWYRVTLQAVLSEEVVSGSWYICTTLADITLLIASELAFDPTGLHGFDFTLIFLGNLHGVWVHFQLTETGSACIQSTARIRVNFSYMQTNVLFLVHTKYTRTCYCLSRSADLDSMLSITSLNTWYACYQY